MKLKTLGFIIPVINILTLSKTQTQITSVLLDLEPLLEAQKDVIGVLDIIILRKKKILCFLGREIERFKHEHKKAIKRTKYYLRNPINSVTLIKRLTFDLDFIEHVIDEQTDLRRNSLLTYPSNEDLKDADEGLHLLQMVYKLNVTQLADGILNTTFSYDGKLYSEVVLPMTTFDCYDVGRVLCERNLHKHGLPWLLEAHRLLLIGRPSYGLKEITIVLTICKAYNAIDDNEKYIDWTQKLIDLKPKVDIIDLQVYIDIHRVRWGKKEWAKKQALELGREKIKLKSRKKYLIKKNPPLNPVDEVKACKLKKISKGYKTLCRGELNVGSYIAKRLKCWYSLGHHPFSRLARIRTEQLYVKPDIFLFYNVLHDTEIATVKNFAEPRLQTTKTKSRGMSSPNRLFKFATVDQNCEITKLLTQRIADFSGLDLTGSEPYHVINYGVWGFHAQHVDYWQDQRVTDKLGKRLATTILYMSEAEQGGATVFPALGLTVYPVKGAALLWTNLHPSGEEDNATCHGTCPVLRGSMWAITKWINACNQELTKPCTMKFQSRRPRDIPYPENK